MDTLMMRKRLMMQPAGGGGLPGEYQQVEWLGMDGTQYLNLGTELFYNDEIYFDFLKTGALDNNTNAGYGAGSKVTNCIISGGCIADAGNQPVLLKFKTTGVRYGVKARDFIGNRAIEHTILGDALTSSLSFNGNNYSISPLSVPSDWHSVGRLCIGGMGPDYSYVVPSMQRVFSFQLIRNGSKIIDLIPCYRKADNIRGMYDVSARQFFTNQGSGEFTVGPDVIL